MKLTLTLSVFSVKYYEQSRPVERSGYADDASGNDCGYQQRLFITATWTRWVARRDIASGTPPKELGVGWIDKKCRSPVIDRWTSLPQRAIHSKPYFQLLVFSPLAQRPADAFVRFKYHRNLLGTYVNDLFIYSRTRNAVAESQAAKTRKKKAEIRIFYHNGTCVCPIQLACPAKRWQIFVATFTTSGLWLGPEGLMLGFVMKTAMKSIYRSAVNL